MTTPPLPAPEKFSARLARWLTPQRFFLGLVLAGTLVAYAATLEFGFVFDDHEQIVNAPYLRTWGSLWQDFTQPLWRQFSPSLPHNYYRPVFALWLHLIYGLFGPAAWAWHLSSLLLHATITWLVYRVACRLSGDSWLAVLTALFFGLHPAHAEAVAWISACPELLMSVCLLVAFLCFLRSYESPRRNAGFQPAEKKKPAEHRHDHPLAMARARGWLIASLAFYALGALSKESAAAFPLILLAYGWLRGPVGALPPVVGADGVRPGRAVLGPAQPESWPVRAGQALLPTLPFWTVTAAYLFARLKVLGGIAYTLTALPFSEVALTLPSLLALYARHLLWPVHLSGFYDFPAVQRPGMWNFALPLLVVIVAGTVLWWAARRSRLAALATAWLILPILPALNIGALPEGEFFHDRYLYLSLFGFSLLLALAWRQVKWGSTRLLAGQPAVQIIGAGVLACVLGFRAERESVIWANDLTLSVRGVEVAPQNAHAWNNLGRAWGDRGDFIEAEEPFLKALRLQPDYWEPNYNLGLLYFHQSKLPQAEQYLRRAAEIHPLDVHAYRLLAEVVASQGRLEEAAGLLRRALDVDPSAQGCHLALGAIRKAQGRFREALDEFKAEWARYPDNAAARAQIAATEGILKSSTATPPPADQNAQPPAR